MKNKLCLISFWVRVWVHNIPLWKFQCHKLSSSIHDVLYNSQRIYSLSSSNTCDDKLLRNVCTCYFHIHTVYISLWTLSPSFKSDSIFTTLFRICILYVCKRNRFNVGKTCWRWMFFCSDVDVYEVSTMYQAMIITVTYSDADSDFKVATDLFTHTHDNIKW